MRDRYLRLAEHYRRAADGRERSAPTGVSDLADGVSRRGRVPLGF